MNRNDFSNALKIFMCCTGAVIGAGFASGQEILSFFVRYGKWGGWGIILSAILFFVFVYAVLKKIYVCGIEDFDGYFDGLVGKKSLIFIKFTAYGFMLASFCVMVSGSGAVAEDMWGDKTLGILLMVAICLVAFLKGDDGMIAVNAIMTPLIVSGIVLVGILALWDDGEVFLNFSHIAKADNFVSSSLIYVSYNTVTLTGVLISLKDKVTSKPVAFLSAFLSGVFLLVSGLVLFLVISRSDAFMSPLPMLYIAQRRSAVLKYIYAAVLYMAMITTAVSSGYAFLDFMKKYVPFRNTALSLIICTFSVPLSYVGFAELVNRLYRFFGVLGMFVLVIVIADGMHLFKRVKTKNSLC